jgi:uncharacterized protein (DUF934 family)
MGDPVVSLTDFLVGSNATSVRIEPGEDARLLIPHLHQLTLIEVTFPKFRDGRGYSSARILREAGYDETLRAVGDVLVDQIAFMTRCGFDDFAPDDALNQADVEAALARFEFVYQKAADGAVPVWKLRHG